MCGVFFHRFPFVLGDPNLLGVVIVTQAFVSFNKITWLNTWLEPLILGLFEVLPVHMWKLYVFHLHDCRRQFYATLSSLFYFLLQGLCVCARARVWLEVTFVSYAMLTFFLQKGKLCF